MFSSSSLFMYKYIQSVDVVTNPSSFSIQSSGTCVLDIIPRGFFVLIYVIYRIPLTLCFVVWGGDWLFSPYLSISDSSTSYRTLSEEPPHLSIFWITQGEESGQQDANIFEDISLSIVEWGSPLVVLRFGGVVPLADVSQTSIRATPPHPLSPLVAMMGRATTVRRYFMSCLFNCREQSQLWRIQREPSIWDRSKNKTDFVCCHGLKL